MSGAVKDSLERLRETTQADSMSEVIRRALAVYDFLWEAKQAGDKPILRSKDGNERELVLL